MSSQDKFNEIARLAALLCDGQVTEAEMAVLDRLLLDDPVAQAYYRHYRTLDVALEWNFFDRAFQPAPMEEGSAEDSVAADVAALQAEVDSLPGLPAPPPLPREGRSEGVQLPSSSRRGARSEGKSPVLGFLGDLGRQGWGYVSDHTLLFSALAGLVFLAATVILATRNGDLARQNSAAKSEIASSSPARLVRAKDCRWNGQSPAPEVGLALPVGQSLKLASGVAEIQFDIGAKVILQSPADFQLLSANSARLKTGKATVEIEKEVARGFTILTPETKFVDQGTEFGVEVTPGGNSKIHVFKGMVDVDQKPRQGQAAPPTHRLVENAGARMKAGEEGMTLIEDTGECFIRSMEEADRDQHVVAYWRFEDRPVGILLPDTGANLQSVCATVDSSFNGNDLYVAMARNRPMFAAGVAASEVPQTGISNHSCLDTSQPATDINRLNVYTHSEFSHASPMDVQRITPAQWTIEASVKAAKLLGKAQGFLGRDANFTYETTRAPARLTFQIDARDRFAISYFDADGRFHEAVAEDLPVEAGRWYHLAATSDGRVLRLYVDALDGRGYVQHAATELPATGSTALGKGQDNAEWTIGRAGNAGDPANWLRFWGWIDEIRISDIAREPANFLFASKQQIGDNRVGER